MKYLNGVVILLLLTSCSFGIHRLQHQYIADPIYYKPTTSNTLNSTQSFDRTLQMILTEQQFNLTTDKDKAVYKLIVDNLKHDTRYETIGTDGQAREQTVSISLNYSLLDNKDRELLKPQILSTHRTITLNTHSVLSLELAEQSLLSELYHELVNKIADQVYYKLLYDKQKRHHETVLGRSR